MPVLEGATKGPGTSIGDGFRVPDGARLLGPNFPIQKKSPPAHMPSGDGWIAFFAVDGDVPAVYDALIEQARHGGATDIPRAAGACVYDVEYTRPSTGTSTAHQAARSEHGFVALDGSPIVGAEAINREGRSPHTYSLRCEGEGSLTNGKTAKIFVRRGGIARDPYNFGGAGGGVGFESIAELVVSNAPIDRPNGSSPFESVPSAVRRRVTSRGKGASVPAPPKPAATPRLPEPGAPLMGGYAEATIEKGSKPVAPPFGNVCHGGFTVVLELGSDPQSVLTAYEQQLAAFLKSPREEDAGKPPTVEKQTIDGASVTTITAYGLNAALKVIAVVPSKGAAYLLLNGCDIDR
ncbi:MAG TPA: hypothetical protein VHP57_05150 [Acidimicrobiia bacterium]|nr:hypothetical protein [Acidimicrobiia bacterium]